MMYDEMFDNDNATPIGRCADCGKLIYDTNTSVYIDADDNYFCDLACALNFYGIHMAEDYLC